MPMKAINQLVGVSDNTVQGKNKLIHEHDFVRASSVPGANKSLVKCITCGIYYGELSGRA
jgi:hypothetical protein